MATRWQVVLGISAAAVVVAAPLVYSAHRNTHNRNFRVVEDGVLYRSGQLSPAGLERVVHECGIKTIITLRASRTRGGADPDAWEERFCLDRRLNHVRIVPRVWGADEKGEVPAQQNVEKFLEVMDNSANYPVLVHCFAGVHRTGTMCAIYRMEFHRWPAERAITEMQQCGFDPADMIEDIEGFLRSYTPRWKQREK
jgi:tyrosine-protein phosphatase SIW14